MNTIKYIALISVFIPMAILVWNRYYRVEPLFFILANTLGVIVNYSFYLFHINQILFFHLYTPIELFALLFYFSRLLPLKRENAPLLIALIPIIIDINIGNLHNYDAVSGYFSLTVIFILSVWGLVHLTQEKTREFYGYEVLFVTGIMVYSVCASLSYFETQFLWTLNALGNIISNVLISISVYKEIRVCQIRASYFK